MKRTIIITAIVIVALIIAYLVYANAGKIKAEIQKQPPVNKPSDKLIDGEAVAMHGGWGVPEGIDGDKLHEDITLQFGSVGDEVKMLQSVLNGVPPGHNITTDGIFGFGTRSLLVEVTGRQSITLNELYEAVNKVVWAK